MLQALIGLFVGAVLTGAVGMFSTARARALGGRVGSLMLWRDLDVTHKLIADDAAGKREVTSDRLRKALVTWDEKQESFAAGVNAHDFYKVMSGFNAITRQADRRDAKERSEEGELNQDLGQLKEAADIAWRRGIARFDSSLDPDQPGCYASRRKERFWLPRR